ncbi:hypothetical protein ACFQ0P_13710 [Microbacterium insulae]|uniref:Lipoprotein n=1 Tax=Microbacterium insulae TaxID=483014 RepID=A0ABW3AKV7_9MICO
MTSRTTPLRHAVRAPVGVVLLILAVSLAGCVPADPAAAPTPSFSNEAEAFAAAEATYREYVKALNAVDLSDPETFEGVYAWTTGELNASDRRGLSEYHAEGVVKSGASEVLVTAPIRDDVSAGVAIAVCLDVSDVELVNSAGESLVDPDRGDVQTLEATFSRSSTSPTGLLLTGIGPREGKPECRR